MLYYIILYFAKGPRADINGVTSVTHFTGIHLKCHMSAAKADKNMKQPKSEWEGAYLFTYTG